MITKFKTRLLFSFAEKFTFSSWIVSTRQQLAHAQARAIAVLGTVREWHGWQALRGNCQSSPAAVIWHDRQRHVYRMFTTHDQKSHFFIKGLGVSWLIISAGNVMEKRITEMLRGIEHYSNENHPLSFARALWWKQGQSYCNIPCTVCRLRQLESYYFEKNVGLHTRPRTHL